MDGERFDAAVKRATITSRRGVLGLALGGALAGSGGKASAATCQKPCGPCRHCKHGRCRVKPNGSACGSGNVCRLGVCVMAGACSEPADYCHAVNVCGPIANDCRCFATFSGSSICGEIGITCNVVGCTSDSQCGPGEACVFGAGGCGVPCPGNGYGCVVGCPVQPPK